ncbi:MAG TPA: gamma-glutamylcyclotransferase family protein [Flavobacteriales bacterium]|jgi:gamma-glutamylcyclotransferase (GGCT)/AIG2-like uncharacterized protein YtfP|nr:gamma-glutamylcyclotransferase family protein [Flavobacteriales bacterium]
MSKQVRHIFVYGTLGKQARNPARRALAKYAAFAREATVKGRLFDLGEYPGAVPSRGARDRVSGELYAIDQDHAEELLKVLDSYEEFDPDDKSDSLFVRDVTEVYGQKSEPLKAWIYWYNGEKDRTAEIPSGDYKQYRARVANHAKGRVRAKSAPSAAKAPRRTSR